MTSIVHWLNTPLRVYRPEGTADGSGGQTVTWRPIGEVDAKIDQPRETERTVADQHGSDQDYSIYMEPDADVLRGDQLRHDDGRVWRINGTFTPSTPRYLRCEAELIQADKEV